MQTCRADNIMAPPKRTLAKRPIAARPQHKRADNSIPRLPIASASVSMRLPAIASSSSSGDGGGSSGEGDGDGEGDDGGAGGGAGGSGGFGGGAGGSGGGAGGRGGRGGVYGKSSAVALAGPAAFCKLRKLRCCLAFAEYCCAIAFASGVCLGNASSACASLQATCVATRKSTRVLSTVLPPA